MSTFWNFVFAFILIVVWLVAAGYATQSEIYITDIKNGDPNINFAWVSLFVVAFLTWALLAIFLILIGLSIFGVITLFGSGVGEAAVAESSLFSGAGTKVVKKVGIPWLTIFFLIFALLIVKF